MGTGQSRGWDLRDAVIAAGAVAGVVFVLVELTGSDVDQQVSQATSTALVVVLFTILGSVGAALVHWQPRFALFGAVTVTISLLAGGATVVSTWASDSFLFGFGFGSTSGTVSGVTALLAIASSATCVLLATARADEDGGTRLVRVAAIGALALFVGLAILEIVDHDVDIGPRAYAILATVYVIATAVLLVLRLLPTRADLPASS